MKEPINVCHVHYLKKNCFIHFLNIYIYIYLFFFEITIFCLVFVYIFVVKETPAGKLLRIAAELSNHRLLLMYMCI